MPGDGHLSRCRFSLTGQRKESVGLPCYPDTMDFLTRFNIWSIRVLPPYFQQRSPL